jgi:hypothetical protein
MHPPTDIDAIFLYEFQPVQNGIDARQGQSSGQREGVDQKATRLLTGNEYWFRHCFIITDQSLNLSQSPAF